MNMAAVRNFSLAFVEIEHV